MRAARKPHLAPDRAESRTLDLDEGTITVRRLPPGAWDRLVDAHPPKTPGAVGWHPDTFPPALLAASVTHLDGQRLTPTAATQVATNVWAEWTPDAADTLYDTCIQLSAPRGLTWARARLDRDPRLALEVAWCVTSGVAPSVFAGWEQRDRDLILASWLRTRTACPGCGCAWEHMGDYDAPVEVDQRECVWCVQRDAAQAQVPEDHRAGVHTFVTPAVTDVEG